MVFFDLTVTYHDTHFSTKCPRPPKPLDNSWQCWSKPRGIEEAKPSHHPKFGNSASQSFRLSLGPTRNRILCPSEPTMRWPRALPGIREWPRPSKSSTWNPRRSQFCPSSPGRVYVPWMAGRQLGKMDERWCQPLLAVNSLRHRPNSVDQSIPGSTLGYTKSSLVSITCGQPFTGWKWLEGCFLHKDVPKTHIFHRFGKKCHRK